MEESDIKYVYCPQCLKKYDLFSQLLIDCDCGYQIKHRYEKIFMPKYRRLRELKLMN